MHYHSSRTFGPASVRQQNDELKKLYTKQMGITLIPIPYWWDKSVESLAATIQSYRIDLSEFTRGAGSPISTTIPARVFKYEPNVAQEYADEDPTGW
jgi:hypothetical protein